MGNFNIINMAHDNRLFIALTCNYEVYEDEYFELSEGLREFLDTYKDGKYHCFDIALKDIYSLSD